MSRISLFLGLVVAVLCLAGSASASASDSVYWVDYEAQTIDHAGLAGGGGTIIPITGEEPPPGKELVEGPYGLALDPAAGKIYWSNWDGNTIVVANLDGSDAHLLNTGEADVEEPAGLSIDEAAGRIYWANSENNTIAYANLDGSGGHDLNTSGATIDEPYGIVFYPPTGRVYVANAEGDSISYANVDDSGGDQLDTTGVVPEAPRSPAIDPTTNRIYWANYGDSSAAFANLSGGGGGSFKLDTSFEVGVEGIALDTPENRLYFGDVNPDTIGVTSLSGGPVGQVEIAPVSAEYISFPALLKTPSNVSAPAISLTPKPVVFAKPRKGAPPIVQSQSQTLNCSRGAWAADQGESFLYRAPQTFSYQWLHDGKPIAGANGPSFAATEVGSYTCQVTATNGAGPKASTSGPVTISASFELGRAKVNKKKGIATLPFASSGSGGVRLSGKSLKSRTVTSGTGSTAPLNGTLVVKPKGKARAKLKSKGRAKVNAKVTYTPTGGSPIVRTKSITLKLAG